MKKYLDKGIYVSDIEDGICEKNGDFFSCIWGLSLTPLGNTTKEYVVTYNNFKDYWDSLLSIQSASNCELRIYVHDLNKIGKLIVHYLGVEGYTLGISNDSKSLKNRKDLNKGQYYYLVSNKGDWYNICVRINEKVTRRGNTMGIGITFLDSKKLLPFKIGELQDGFNTSVKANDSVGNTYYSEGTKLNQDVLNNIINKTIVVSESLCHMFNAGLNKLTIGSCCFSEFKKTLLKETYGYVSSKSSVRDFRAIYPNLLECKNKSNSKTHESQEDFVRKSYNGGLVMVEKGKEGIVYNNGCSLDCNGIYSYVMHSENGEEGIYGRGKFPIGVGSYFADSNWYEETTGSDFKGINGYDFYKHIKKVMKNSYVFLHIKSGFKIKKDGVPFIKIQGAIDERYCASYEDSRLFFKGEYYSYSKLEDGSMVRADIRDLWLSEDDFELFLDNYDVYDLTVCEGYVYRTNIGCFDSYIDKYHSSKMRAREEGNVVKSTISKLMLNNLSGKFGTKISNNQLAYVEDEYGDFNRVELKTGGTEPIYVPVVSAVTSKARRVLINAIKLNRKYFIFCDTDSLKLSCSVDKVKGLKISSTELGAWKLENVWEKAVFLRSKCYATVIDGNYSVTCSGMSDHARRLLECTMQGIPFNQKYLSDYEKDFHKSLLGCGLKVFKIGLTVPGDVRRRPIKFGSGLTVGAYKILDVNI